MFIVCGFNFSSPVLFLCSSVSDVLVSLRSIYNDQPNAHKRFMEKLDARIRNHDREIEKMCNFHHQGFVDAITELLKVRADAEKLMVRKKRLAAPLTLSVFLFVTTRIWGRIRGRH